ncbi:MAG TPA: hypothetical protein VNX68_19650 [Nitrosopumilaceae archaeon]|jgi:hypothetical protein|nr:hypothetical protein [Nitrosopumilaceae archaeon]
MDLARLYEILSETTTQLRKGPRIQERDVGVLHVVEIYDMPHEDDVVDDFVEKIDCFFLTIGVRKKEAEARKDELTAILDSYPKPDRLAEGPSYIEVGAVIGDQAAAFSLFALGQVLGLWKVITPGVLGIKNPTIARELAGLGFVLISGYKKHDANS